MLPNWVSQPHVKDQTCDADKKYCVVNSPSKMNFFTVGAIKDLKVELSSFLSQIGKCQDRLWLCVREILQWLRSIITSIPRQPQCIFTVTTFSSENKLPDLKFLLCRRALQRLPIHGWNSLCYSMSNSTRVKVNFYINSAA